MSLSCVLVSECTGTGDVGVGNGYSIFTLGKTKNGTHQKKIDEESRDHTVSLKLIQLFRKYSVLLDFISVAEYTVLGRVILQRTL